jgi:HPt (histidine-containing phosphotransfer) domain-containing protein
MMDWESDPELKQLRAEFIASFEERRGALERAARTGQAEQAHHICHKLAGAASTYGFSTLSKIAGAIEDGMDLAPSFPWRELSSLLTEALARASASRKDPSELLGDPRVARLISAAG